MIIRRYFLDGPNYRGIAEREEFANSEAVKDWWEKHLTQSPRARGYYVRLYGAEWDEIPDETNPYPEQGSYEQDEWNRGSSQACCELQELENVINGGLYLLSVKHCLDKTSSIKIIDSDDKARMLLPRQIERDCMFNVEQMSLAVEFCIHHNKIQRQKSRDL